MRALRNASKCWLAVHQDCTWVTTSAAAWVRLQVQVPPFGESITDGTIASILKKPGDSVEEDEPLLQIETDKVTIDVRSPQAGTVEAILVSISLFSSVFAFFLSFTLLLTSSLFTLHIA
jgi:glycine cleavage system H lipoate-binding protein